ncbi:MULTISPECIES: hypothetical protein [Microbacterium]|uniref:Uncharacterized protein n=1 Tax=Microbacterium thalli TaxID=3027921 RepID=A0ABT5SL66_9MICO|nr:MULTISPECIES: hypothetical protein [Microbacterium]MDD7963580.1 hypothetical protein [Microbacterium thalli]MDN8549548.1 hypothetical protein [Microbacterium thalli]
MRRAKPVIIHIIWAVAGFALGATVALLVIKGFSSEWVEATGTWFGAIATVLTLLWAVQTFRADQAHRERDRVAREEERAQEARDAVRAQEEAERRAKAAIVAEANRVSVDVISGSFGNQRRPNVEVTSIAVKITNDTSRRIRVKSFELDAPLRSAEKLVHPVDVKAMSTYEVHVNLTDPVLVSEPEFTNRVPIERFPVRITYTVGDHTWTRASSGGASLADE